MVAMSWDEARRAASTCVRTGEPVSAPLDQADGAVLAHGLRAPGDMPAVDVAAADGWAVAGPGPWVVRPPRSRDVLASHTYHEATEAVPLSDGQAAPIAAGDPVGSDVAAVVLPGRCRTDGGRLIVLDPVGKETPKVAPGSGIRSRGSDAFAGQELLPPGTTVTPAALSLVVLAGQEELDLIPPPDVAVVRIGDEVFDFGAPRAGLARDATGPALPRWIAGLGARCQPEVWARQGDAELLDKIEDSSAAAIVAHGPNSGMAARRVLAGIGADVAVDAVACRPGGSMLLAVLNDGRPFIHCGSGAPADALAAVVTLVAPVVSALAGRVIVDLERRLDETVRGSRDSTWLIPVAPASPDSPGVLPILPGGPGGMTAWALATHAAVIPPGGITRHRRVQLLSVPGGVAAI